MELNLFSERTLTDVALFFLLQEESKSLPYSKLMRLLYCAERACFKQYGFELTGDILVNSPQGPVLSHAMQFVEEAPEGSFWFKYLEVTKDKIIKVREPYLNISIDDLGELSRGVIMLLHKVKNNILDSFPELGAVGEIITYQRLFDVLGFSKELQQVILEEMEASSMIRSL